MKITIGFTKTFRMGWKGSTIDYVPSMDGYHDDAEQDVLVIEVESPTLDGPTVGEAYFTATNAPKEVVQGNHLANGLFNVMEGLHRKGQLGKHRVTMDVGDTIQIDDGPKFVVMPFGFEEHTPGTVTGGRSAPMVGTA